MSIRAEELAHLLREKSHKQHQLPFSKVINCNIGNPQQLGQKPITFFRQVTSLLENQELLNKSRREEVERLFPKDAIERARIPEEFCYEIMKACEDSLIAGN